MLQQTQVETVIPYYQRWLELFPDLRTLAGASQEQVLKTWEGLGYYSRARNLLAAARVVTGRFSGRFPATWRELRSLPGIGDYTAAAVLSIAFGHRFGVVDGNVLRVVSRLLALKTGTSSPQTREVCRSFVESTFGEAHPGWVNQAWMELGAVVCKPVPDCPSCPLSAACLARRLDRVRDFPLRPERREVPVREGALFLVLDRRPPGTEYASNEPARLGCLLAAERIPLLLVRRQSRGLLGGLWEFPNVELRDGELERFTSDQRLEILRETGLTVRHRYSHFEARFAVTLAAFREETRLETWVEQRWVLPEELPDYPRPRVHIKAMELFGWS